MKRFITLTILAAAITLGSAAATWAEVPTHMSVQGQLRDDTGTPLPAGDMEFSFKIFDAAIGDTEIWPGETIVVPIRDGGLWRARIGGVNPLGSAVFADSSRWLEITVDDGVNPPETLERIELSSHPWAYRADDARHLEGHPASHYAIVGHPHIPAHISPQGSGSGLDADLLDGNQGSYYQDAGNLNVGTLRTDRFSAHSDLTAEGYLDDDAGTDLLTRGQSDDRFVNAAGDTITESLWFIGEGTRQAEWNRTTGQFNLYYAGSRKLGLNPSPAGFEVDDHGLITARLAGASTGALLNLQDSDRNAYLSTYAYGNQSTLYLGRLNGNGARLSGGTVTTGASLRLYGSGAPAPLTIKLDANLSGNNAAVLPAGAIDKNEILDEPGVSNRVNPIAWFYLNAGNVDYVVDSVTINIPSAGYVEVTAGCFLNMYHTGGANTQVYVSVDKVRGNADFTLPGSQSLQVPAGVGTSIWQFGGNVSRLYQETSAGAKKYYLNADYNSGLSTSTNVGYTYIRAKYFPTVYGSVAVTTADDGGSEPHEDVASDGSVSLERTDLRVITVEEHNARVAMEEK